MLTISGGGGRSFKGEGVSSIKAFKRTGTYGTVFTNVFKRSFIKSKIIFTKIFFYSGLYKQ